MSIPFPINRRAAGDDRQDSGGTMIRPAFLVGACAVTLLGFFGCETADSKMKHAPTPLPGRVSVQPFQSQQNTSLFAGKAVVPANGSGTPASKSDAPPVTVFTWPAGFVRVAALPVYTTAPTGHPTNVPTGDSLAALDEVFHSELVKVLPLEVVMVSRDDLKAALGETQFCSTAVLPQKLFQFLKEKYAVQGVLFTDMPIYRPYRPIAIGVRSKLVQLSDMQIMWSANGILDSADPGIAASAMEYAERSARGPATGGAAQTVLQSPRRYAAFVANGLFGTLPGQLKATSSKSTDIISNGR